MASGSVREGVDGFDQLVDPKRTRLGLGFDSPHLHHNKGGLEWTLKGFCAFAY